MAGTLPHAFHFGMRQLHDEEEDAHKDQEEITAEKKDRGDFEDKHAQPEAVQLPETYKTRNRKGLQGAVERIILSQSPMQDCMRRSS